MPRAALKRAKRVVVKVGSRLIDESPAGRPAQIADEVAALMADGKQALIVSSGAIALGAKQLGHKQRPTALVDLQASAAVGQNRLMAHWEHAFRAHQVAIGQVLLSHDDLTDRRRFLNARYVLRALLDAGVVPIVNENDTVATEEIRYGDNDLLSALVTNLIGAEALLILTDVEGLLDAPPSSGGTRVSVVRDADNDAATDAAIDVAGETESGVGSGGMASKVAAARAAARHGVTTVVAGGRRANVVRDVMAGADIGTVFVPSAERISSRKHWIAYREKPTAAIVCDDGAKRALCESGRSLLAAGVTDVRGTFGMGDVVSLITADGAEFARGLPAYPDTDVRTLAGRRTADIEQSLGYKYTAEVIHRDDLVLL